MSFNPLDLFGTSDPNNKKNRSSIGLRPSSPIQETQVLKEIKLQEEHESLLALRQGLQKEIQDLETQWNELQKSAENNILKTQTEENELILQLLLQEESDKENGDGELIGGEKGGSGEDDDSEMAAFDPSEFSTAPLSDWDLRIEYLKKFYPYLEIIEPSSKMTLEYDSNNKPELMKTISFKLHYGKLFRFEIQIVLKSEQNVYSISRLQIRKTSNNKHNTILLQIVEHYNRSRNVNEFLFTVNDLYGMLIDRQKILDDIQTEYIDPNSRDEAEKRINTSLTIGTNSLSIKGFEVSWDIVFSVQGERGSLSHVINVSAEYNSVFQDMLKLKGTERALRDILDTLPSTI